MDVDGKRQKVYGPELCMRLARYDGRKYAELSLENADNYRLFALGATLAKVNWWPDGYQVNVEGQKESY